MLTWPPSGLSKAHQEAVEAAPCLNAGVLLLRRALPGLNFKDLIDLVRQAMEAAKKARAKAKGRWK
jgi:hypothetical protein